MPAGWTIGTTLLLAGWLAAAPVFAEEIKPGHLRIELASKKGRKLPEDKKDRAAYDKAWKRTCDQLGKAMEAGKGPWGFGAFASFSCYRHGKRVAGEDEKADFTLVVTDGEKQASFVLSRDVSKDETTEVSRIVLPGSEHTLSFFQDTEFVDLVAFQLLDGMPFAMQVTRTMAKGSPPIFSGRHWRGGQGKEFKFDVPPPPEELVLYRLSWDAKEGVYQSVVIGTAKRTKIERPKKRKKGKRSTMRGGEVQYETTEAVAAALAGGAVWAHDANGPATRGTDLTPVLKDAQTKLNAAAASGKLGDFLKGKVTDVLASLFDTAASGYVGVRYGLQVLSGDELLKKTSMFSLLVEVRGGPVKGLRYYYDKLPRTTLDQDAVDGTKMNTNISWSRHVLGFSWDFNPGFLVDRITLDPKLGMWDFNATLATGRDEAGLVRNTETFDLGRTFSTALEVGIELLEEWYTLRGWYAIDTGFSLIKKGGKVTSNRFGADAFFTAGPTFPIFGVPFRTALLGFFVFESVDLTSGDASEPDAGEEKITGVGYDGGYAGAGVVLSW